METRRLLWVIALFFSVVLVVQYFELPYGHVLSNLLPFGKSQVTSISSFPTTSASNDTNSLVEKMTSHVPNSKELFNDTAGIKNDTYSDFLEINSSFKDERVLRNNSLAPEMGRGDGYGLSESNYTSTSNSSFDKLRMTKVDPALERNEDKNRNNIHVNSPNITASSVGKEESNMPSKNHSSSTSSKKRRFKGPRKVVVPIPEMNNMLLQSRFSYNSMNARWPSQVDQELLNAKALIEQAQIMEKDPHVDVNMYRNFSAFNSSYKLMEKTLKIYIYAEGERPIFHQAELSGIYASEGWFMKQLEQNKHFVTKKADEAHLFYLPFSSRLLEETLYVPNSHSRKNLVKYLSNYLQNITTVHRFWNRTGGADHFLVACHDWAPAETSRIMKNCIRALCNADVAGGFKFGKDVSLPETFIRLPQNPLKDLGGKTPSQRKILAFFAGKMHGYLRPILLRYWENKDSDIKIFGKLRNVKGETSYIQYMKSSKYCISAKGYEPYTPRVVEAIFYECVPVIISDNYVPPFFETLNWESFAVFVMEKDIPNLKDILLSIPEKRYAEMQERVKQVQKHFLWNPSPVKYDIFHMILHSIWYTRVYQMRTG